jgi:multisubunit Na+/H+ antiporter MnhG subunit
MDSRFGILKTPVGKMLIGRATVADGCKKVGCTVEEAIAKVQEMIARHTEA